MGSFMRNAMAAAVTVGLMAGGASAAVAADGNTPAPSGISSPSVGSMGFQGELGDPVINEVKLSWAFNDKAYWGYKLESDKPAFDDGKGNLTLVKQKSWLDLKERLVLLQEGETYTFKLTDNYSGKTETVVVTVPVDRRSFDTKAVVTGNQVKLTWQDLSDAPQGWLLSGNKGNLAEAALVKKVPGGQGVKEVTFTDLNYGQVTQLRIHNPYTLKTEVVNAYVKPITKQPKATRVVNEVPKPLLVDARGLENDRAEAPTASADVISSMDWNPYNGDWTMTSYTRDPNAAFPNGKRFMVQSGKLVR